MPRFSAAQIYAFAREAGFSPDQATTMTAIAMAESGGDSRAHATVGEDSRGLWQINAAAHPDLAARTDLYDPVQNARAAFQISHSGNDVSPWTTTHGGLSARYLRYRQDAEAAAAAYGDGHDHGVWTGTSGYGHPLAAGDARGRGSSGTGTGTHSAAGANDGSAAVVNQQSGTLGTHDLDAVRIGEEYGIVFDDPDGARDGADFGIPLEGHGEAPGLTDATQVSTGHDGTTDSAHTFLDAALAQAGDQYVFGARTQFDNPDPTQFDCSSLVQWSAHRAGVEVERNAWAQYRQMHDAGTVIPVEQALHTPGALLFSFSTNPNGSSAPPEQHVAISLGDGRTIEAMGSDYGVCNGTADTQRFQYAALVPGLSYDQAPATEAPAGHVGIVLDGPQPEGVPPIQAAAPIEVTDPVVPAQPIDPVPPAAPIDPTAPDGTTDPATTGPAAEPLPGGDPQPMAYHSSMAYGQPIAYDQAGAYDQNTTYGQAGAYDQGNAYGQASAYGQGAYGQAGTYGQGTTYGQAGVQGQPMVYDQSGGYGQHVVPMASHDAGGSSNVIEPVDVDPDQLDTGGFSPTGYSSSGVGSDYGFHGFGPTPGMPDSIESVGPPAHDASTITPTAHPGTVGQVDRGALLDANGDGLDDSLQEALRWYSPGVGGFGGIGWEPDPEDDGDRIDRIDHADHIDHTGHGNDSTGNH